jgi:hypothetical protein
MTNDDALNDGRLAWTKIRSVTTFESWKMVAAAVAIGRQQAMAAIGSNKPFGTKYRHAINAWLEQNGFREMRMGIRTACCILADHLEDIEVWRASLPASEQREQNHPEVIIRNWRLATRADRDIEPRKTMRHTVTGVKRNSHGKPLNPGQDMVRRVAAAIREGWTTDTFMLATTAIRAMLSDPDLVSLLNEAPATSHTRRTAPADADAAVHAA